MMGIERLELLLLEMPYVHFFETSFGREEKKTFILIKVFSQGFFDYGEVTADQLPLYNYETTSTSWVMIKEIFALEPVVAELMPHIHEYQHRAGQSHSQPHDIDERIQFVSSQIS